MIVLFVHPVTFVTHTPRGRVSRERNEKKRRGSPTEAACSAKPQAQLQGPASCSDLLRADSLPGVQPGPGGVLFRPACRSQRLSAGLRACPDVAFAPRVRRPSLAAKYVGKWRMNEVD